MKPTRRIALVLSLISIVCDMAGCDQNRPQMADGLDEFKAVAQDYLIKLENGKIQPNQGFNGECTLDIKTDAGIRISESVCDNNNLRKVTIRVTDPSSRPPSQQLEYIQFSDQSGIDITVYRGKTTTTSNAIGITFDRSGQSVILEGQSLLASGS